MTESLFLYVNAAIGLVLILIGASATAFPKAMSLKFGIKADSAAWPYVISTGIRDVALGLIVLALFARQEWTLLGFAHISIFPVAVSDFLVVRKHGDKSVAWVHLAGALLVAGYGVWLLLK